MISTVTASSVTVDTLKGANVEALRSAADGIAINLPL